MKRARGGNKFSVVLQFLSIKLHCDENFNIVTCNWKRKQLLTMAKLASTAVANTGTILSKHHLKNVLVDTMDCSDSHSTPMMT